MGKDRPSAMLLLIIFMLSIHSISGADLIDTYCPTEFPIYTPNGSFHKNLNLLMESLSSNTASRGGFYNTSIGKEPDSVYGQTLCRGDITNSTVCQECVQKASKDIMNRCKSEDAVIWYELCQVRYSFQMFFSIMVYTGKYPEQIKKEKNVSDDPIRFEEVMKFLMKNLSNEAAFNPARNMFAAGEIEFPRKKTIYGLVQCTRDISETDCSSCLSTAFSELTICCSHREGGIIVSRNCNMRFGLSEFFNTSSAYLLIYPTSKVLIGLCTACIRRKKDEDRDEEKSERTLLQELSSPKNVAITQEGELISSDELLFMPLATIKAATGDFSDTNKLGQGGFGAVYKGVLPDGNEIAVKRLSRKSWQGIEEFKNEVILIAKLQHRNLEDPEQRPTMSDVVVLLGSESMALPQPRQPAFSLGKVLHVVDPSTSTNPSVNESIWSKIVPR
ncbi:Serine-threonine/tyrosine-protein kinase, catalytic domain [Sesbania bispinosa]|nr:Serine-threonine/tyrosine-protein kinase, catalytic domain [Sesbania bispinosa]